MVKKTLPPLHLATSDDDLRPALMNIAIVDGIATATNAHLIVQLNLKEYSKLPDECIKALSNKFIHRDVWEVIQNADLIEVEGNVLHYEEGGIKADFEISEDVKFPDFDSLIKAVANSMFDRKSFICFNPKMIEIAKKIFPSENLIMRFYENNEMLLIFPSGDAKGFVGIMPIKISQEEAVLDFTLS
jgi:hypothetical protein